MMMLRAAVAWHVFDLSHSAFHLGMIGLVQFVPVHRRAWHAGVSRWRGRGRCNDFSVGIELEGTDDRGFSEAQYAGLPDLVRALRAALPLREIAAHSDIAPGRKTDPGVRFDWPRLFADLARA